MSQRCKLMLGGIALLAMVFTLQGHGLQPNEAIGKPTKSSQKGAAKTAQAWTLEEALAQLKLNQHDAYLQYVALQLARREKDKDRLFEEIENIISEQLTLVNQFGRRDQVDLFSLFTGALAVQESLQLDTMRGNSPGRRQRPDVRPTDKKPDGIDKDKGGRRDPSDKPRKEMVAISRLRGPSVKSHPWETMLGNKKPKISVLSRAVPDDFFLAEFRSLTKLLDVMDVNDLWGKHLFSQAVQDARTSRLGERIKTQLVLETSSLFRQFYDLVVEEVAISGSDLFLREGSDVTILFRFKQPDVFKARMEGFAKNVQKKRPGVERRTGKILGVDYEYLGTPDREVSVYSAYPEEGLHVRSNSKAAFRRILEAVRGKTAAGRKVQRLGDTAEFQYVRTLMPLGACEEDGFVYLSDPFIRRLVGPQVKLTERRRMLCFNHLKMIGHAALMYRTERGKAQASLASLAKAECSPGEFNKGRLTCPCGGTYSLSADGSGGVCSHHGNDHFLTPCGEIPLTQVSGPEADEYKDFVKEYNQYWKTYFDPIALRVQVSPRQYRVETIILPLIDNSVYTGLARVLGGKPEALDALPVPKRNILSLNFRLNKEELVKEAGKWLDGNGAEGEALAQEQLRRLGVPERVAKKLSVARLKTFLTKGVGNQVGLHMYDAAPFFDINVPSLLGELMGSFTDARSGRFVTGDTGQLALVGGFVISSLTAPVYIALPVQDAKIVDAYLDDIDVPLAFLSRKGTGSGFFDVKQDFYKFPGQHKAKFRAYSLRLGPIKWRFFWARIGNGLYIASKPFILEDLAALEAARSKQANPERTRDQGPKAHAMVRMRPEHYSLVLPESRLAWAENNRQACFKNLGPVSYAGRALAAQASWKQDEAANSWDKRGRLARQAADQLYWVHFFCPESGNYLLSADGRTCKCSIHGSIAAPQQPAAPNEDSALGKLRKEFTTMTAALTFLEDGLHAVVIMDRKQLGE
jgi:hypothetical protein